MKTKLEIIQGATYKMPVRWGVDPIKYLPIGSLAGLTPLKVSIPGHGLPNGWRVEIVSVQGMTEVNSSGRDKPADYHNITVLPDAQTIEFNDINAADFSDYVGGGFLKCDTPKDLTGYKGRLTVKDKIGGVTLLTLTTDDGNIEVDAANFTIIIFMTAAETEALTWVKGVFDLEMVDVPGNVDRILSGTVVVSKEVTTSVTP